MKISSLIFILCLFSLGAYADNELIEVFRNIRCLECGGQSIEDSNSVFAKHLRSQIRNEFKQGVTKSKIYENLEKEYGKGIFFTAPGKKQTSFIVALFAFMSLILFFIYKRRI